MVVLRPSHRRARRLMLAVPVVLMACSSAAQARMLVNYNIQGYATISDYEHRMIEVCGHHDQVGQSSVFGSPSDYRAHNPQLGMLSAQIDASKAITARSRGQIQALLSDVKKKKANAYFGIQASYRTEAYAKKEIENLGAKVPAYSRQQNIVYRHEEQKIIRHQNERGVNGTIQILVQNQDLRNLKGCRTWWAYEDQNPTQPASKWFR